VIVLCDWYLCVSCVCVCCVCVCVWCSFMCVAGRVWRVCVINSVLFLCFCVFGVCVCVVGV